MSNKLKNCPECGRLFLDTGVGICRDCVDKQEQLMLDISSYVRDHPHSKVKEVCEALNVKEKLVMKMIREGRFVTEGIMDLDLEYPCAGGCGVLINNGKYCPQCAEKMQKKLEQTEKAMEKRLEEEKRGLGTGMYSKDLSAKGTKR